MIPKYLHVIGTAVVPVLGDHLWQSTLFAVAAGLLTLLLKTNRARVRYWLWLAASVKFLIPFSLLVGIGTRLALPGRPARTNAGLYFAMEEVSLPFTESARPASSGVLASTVYPNLVHLLPVLLVTMWLIGFVALLAAWYLRWQKMAAAMRQAVPLHHGREVEALCRIEHILGIPRRIKIRLSSVSMEPGVFGIARPVLVWPEGISEHLEDAHVEAIVAHEVWHVRRRDNLAAAIHMVMEAVFWFHPLVWWLGQRLVDERERACDEDGRALGSEGKVYGESILKTCEFCVRSPFACVSGITGADLKKRIAPIMTQRVVRKLDFRKKLLLGVAGLVAVALPLVFGLLSATPGRAESQASNTASAPAYEVASIKPDKSGEPFFKIMASPNGLTATTTLQMLIRLAYGVENNQISGAPSWVDSVKYQIDAKMDNATADEVRKLSEDQREPARQRMLRALLEDRFKLALHRETKELPVYSLVVAKNGPKLQEAKPGEPDGDGIKGPDGRPAVGGHFVHLERGQLNGHSLGMADIVRLFSQQLDRTVVDKTGLTGNYDFTLHWTPDESQDPTFKEPAGGQGAGDSAPPESSGPSIFTAIQEQLGLKLESQKGPVEILVIDHVEKPSEN
jgi:bla regulator protein BlaR1